MKIGTQLLFDCLVDMAHSQQVIMLLIGSFSLWKCINGQPVIGHTLNKTIYNIEGQNTSEDNSSGLIIISISYEEEKDKDVISTTSTTMIESINVPKTNIKKENPFVSFQLSRIYEVTRHIRLSIDICFLFGIVIIIEGIHLFCLEYLIRLARPRFVNHKRFKLYSSLTIALAFFISFSNLLLVVLFYKSIDFCH